MKNFKYYTFALSLMVLGLYSCTDEEFGSSIDALDPLIAFTGASTVELEDEDVAFSAQQRLGSTYAWSATGATLSATGGSAVEATFDTFVSSATISVTETTRSGKTVTKSHEIAITNTEPTGTLSWGTESIKKGMYKDGDEDTLFATYDFNIGTPPGVTSTGLTTELSSVAMTPYKTTMNTFFSVITFDAAAEEVDFVVNGAVRSLGGKAQKNDEDAEGSAAIDNKSPTASLSFSAQTVKNKGSVDIMIDFVEEVLVTTSDSTIAVNITGTGVAVDTLLKWNGSWLPTTYTFKDGLDLGDQTLSFTIGAGVTDLAGNAAVTTPKVSKPLVADNTPATANATADVSGGFVTITGSMDEAGTMWFVLQKAADSPPTSEDFTANAVISGTYDFEVARSNTWDDVVVASGDYALYVYSVDAAGNASAVVQTETPTVN